MKKAVKIISCKFYFILSNMICTNQNFYVPVMKYIISMNINSFVNQVTVCPDCITLADLHQHLFPSELMGKSVQAIEITVFLIK